MNAPFDHMQQRRFRLPAVIRAFGMMMALVLVGGCDRPQGSSSKSATPAVEAAETSAGAEADRPAEGEIATLAGGCFWGMEDILRDVPGVLHTEVGYSGGSTQSPTYDVVKKGNSGHAEAVKIVFDPKKISYAELLEKWFFRMHDPTTENRQGNDVGSQYRSAIFFTNEAQKKMALSVIQRVQESGQWKDPIVTEVQPAGAFTPAEEYHQDYLEKNPGGYTCHYMRDPVY